MADWWNPFSWFSQGAADWLGGLGGDVASGIEGGFVAVLKDIAKTMIPWFEIALGIILAIFTLAVYFHEDTAKLGGMALKAAVA